jgi:hypothetical protein
MSLETAFLKPRARDQGPRTRTKDWRPRMPRQWDTRGSLPTSGDNFLRFVNTVQGAYNARQSPPLLRILRFLLGLIFSARIADGSSQALEDSPKGSKTEQRHPKTASKRPKNARGVQGRPQSGTVVPWYDAVIVRLRE